MRWDDPFARNIHGESNVWSTVQRHKHIYRFDVHAGFEGKYRSVGYGNQCFLVWSCVEERGWSCLKMALDFDVEEESMKVGLRRKDALCVQSGVSA